MNTADVSRTTLVRVGTFTLLGVAAIIAITVFVNNRPFWWRKCEPIMIAVEDATGLKTKSPIRSLGLQIGYLKSVELTETRVKLGICITAPVDILPNTKAYIRGEGFLGDKFVELKPVRYTGNHHVGGRTNFDPPASEPTPIVLPAQDKSKDDVVVPSQSTTWYQRALDIVIPQAYAAEEPKEVQVGQSKGDMDKLMKQADGLMVEMTDLTKNLKEGLNPKELRETIQQLNKTLANASKALSPEGNLNSTARRSLEKLEDAFEQMRQQMTRINKGEGSLGRLLNDPVYADELLKAAKNLNKLLNKASDIRFVVNLGAQQIPVYNGGRAFFHLQVWPTDSRYYLIGITVDPRGKLTTTDTTTTSGGQSTLVQTQQIEEGGLLLTGMMGKVFFKRLDLSVGAYHGDGAVSIALNLGPRGAEEMFIFRNDVYARGKGVSANDRITIKAHPFWLMEGLKNLYVDAGVDSLRKVNGKTPWLVGGGISFDDEDIKLLFAFK